MAIRVLLDHGVPQENIIFVAFIVASSGGVRALHHAFPRVRIVCGMVDPVLRECWAQWDDATPDAWPQTPQPQTQPQMLTDGHGRKVWVVEPGMGHIGVWECVICRLSF